ncbi:hypothetical protein DSECCO2_585900 [anaerobic digester metagenome]
MTAITMATISRYTQLGMDCGVKGATMLMLALLVKLPSVLVTVALTNWLPSFPEGVCSTA